MNCPYCQAEMETGYLRGSHGYALLWTDDPFKATSLPFGSDFWVCKETDIDKPTANLCKSCKTIIYNWR